MNCPERFPVRILWVSPRQSWPANTGAKLRDFFLAKALGSIGELTYVHFIEAGMRAPQPSELPFCNKLISVRKPRPYTAYKLLSGLVGSRPLPIINYFSREMLEVLTQMARGPTFDIVHLDSVHLAAYQELFATNALLIAYDWHNIESEALERYSIEARNPAKRWYSTVTARRMKVLESRILARSFGHVVCSRREEKLLLHRSPNARVATIPNGVDVSYFRSSRLQPQWPPRQIIFVGAMNYYPNVDAAKFFVSEVWPRLKLVLPECEFTIVGSNPVPEILALRKRDGVEVTGTVKDVRQYYASADLVVVPLRLGGGTRLKILEALAAKVPVISTVIGAEGLEVQDGRDITIADAQSAESWIQAIRLLGDSAEHRQKLIAAGSELVAMRYDWPAVGKLLCETYANWLGRG